MPEFVHLHLHTEFSLLDGACRIDELLDEAVALKMPAIAVTEHGNMFSSVVFHDHAKARGLNPILGCEVYVAPGDRRTKSGVPGETQKNLGGAGGAKNTAQHTSYTRDYLPHQAPRTPHTTTIVKNDQIGGALLKKALKFQSPHIKLFP